MYLKSRKRNYYKLLLDHLLECELLHVHQVLLGVDLGHELNMQGLPPDVAIPSVCPANSSSCSCYLFDSSFYSLSVASLVLNLKWLLNEIKDLTL